jgi:predicted O-methyltransferase YrrM
MKHFFQDLSGTFMFPEFYTWLIEKEARAVHAQFKRPMRFAEIGVYKGQSAAYFGVEAMLKLPKEMWPEMHLVDLGLFGHGGSIKQNLTPITDLVRLEWDASSVDVAKKYDDAYFDVVFIDADHGYESVKADIAAWLPKVIAGGIIAGHDFAFQHPGVMQAVQEAFPEFNVIRGRKWDEQKWKTVEEDESGSYIPVWWIRTKRVAPTTRTAALKVLATPHETFPDLQALTAGISRANPLYAADLVRLKERSQAYDGGFGTNVPLLAAVLAVAPPGDVLELGAGNFSTPLMSEMCRAMQRRLVTVDSNLDWITRFGDITDETRIVNGATLSWDEASKGRWAVALVDMAAGCDRAAAIEFLRHRADFIVVHDTHNNYFAGVDAVLATFVHRYDYTSLCPTTTVVSETLNYP